MKIIVTQVHIDRGERRSRERCPISLALEEQAGGSWRVGPVGAWNPRGYNGDPSFDPWGAEKDGEGRVRLPDEAVAFAKLYDRGFVVYPFTFELAAEG